MIKFEAPEIKITILEIQDTIATSSTGTGSSGDTGSLGGEDD